MRFHREVAYSALVCLLLAVPSFAAFPGTAAGPRVTAEPGTTAPAAPRVDEQVQYLGTAVLTCTDLTAAGTGAAILDRDNTGTGSETVNIQVTDGVGTVLYDLTFTNALGSYSGGLISTVAYTAAPLSNPLTLTVTSPAGNGLPQQVGFVAHGACTDLGTWAAIPTLSGAGFAALALALAAAAVVWMRRARRAA